MVNEHLAEEKRYVRGAVEKVGYGLERFLFLKVNGRKWVCTACSRHPFPSLLVS